MSKRASSKAGFDDFLNEIEAGELVPVYIFTGDQIYLMEQALSKLRTKLLGKSDDTNLFILYGDSASGNEIVGNASTYSMFSDKKVLVVKNADRLPSQEIAIIDEYIASPSPSTCLVLMFSDGKNPKIKNKAHTLSYTFSLKGKNAASIAIEEARKMGFRLTRDGAETLISLVGDNLQEINNELIKLSTYKSEGEEIDGKTILELTNKNKFQDVFALINAISKRDKSTAHKVLADLEAKGEEPLSILSRITWRFRLMWRAKELIEKKAPRTQILRELKMSPGAFYYISEDQKKFSYDDITRIMSILGECDKKLKTSYIARNFTLTKLTLDLCVKKPN